MSSTLANGIHASRHATGGADPVSPSAIGAATDSAVVHLAGTETVTGTKTFSAPVTGSVTGNAGTATKLATARNINGVLFDGSADITVADATKVPTSTTVNGHALTSNVAVSAADVGLGNVNNTSDANKPVSTAQQAAIDTAPATIYEVSGVYPLRNTVTTNAARTVIWLGPDAPTSGSGYAISGVDVWFVT